MTTHGVLLFALANANLGFTDMAGALLAAMPRIQAACEAATSGGIGWSSATAHCGTAGLQPRRPHPASNEDLRRDTPTLTVAWAIKATNRLNRHAVHLSALSREPAADLRLLGTGPR
ncbi:hypothetical protein JCM9534A_46600 [Catenuloplanes indicus JCM 9534]|uniref:Uncharacterized protein n=1 Tax=Catenuloplanes indicus TaxID=137267 RepID=A0AAE3W307_9ACTN|nr:hypothetical protein [Catenuloplanes indicus]